MKTKEKKDWFDDHVIIMGSSKKINEKIKQKIKDGFIKNMNKKEKK